MQPVDRRAHARRVGDVTRCELGAPARELRAAPRVAHEGADVAPLRAERVDDLRADEPRSAGDEDLHRPGSVVKFCQYRLGVGPRWPWYFDPSASLPYGADAGSVSCMKDSWPIFIPR